MSTVPLDDGRGAGGVVVLLVVLALVATGLVVDSMLDEPAAAGPEPVERLLTAGITTCAAGVVGDDSEVVVASVADGGLVESQNGFSVLEVQAGGLVRELAPPDTTGRAVAAAVSGLEGDVLVAARWHEVPVLLNRRWTQGDSARVPGAVEGPCPARSAARWVVPGVATAGGASAQLHLANVTDEPASVAVRFTTPDGPVAPTRLSNLVVGAHDRLTLELNEFAPEEPDLGVIVEAISGLVVVEATQGLEAAVGGVDGRSLVAAHPEPAPVWTVPWVSAADGESAWVWVTNPSDDVAEVGLVVHTLAGPIVPPAGGATLAPGETQRVDLRGALGEVAVGGATVRSLSGTPIVVSGAVVRAVEDDPVRGGIAVVEAAVAGAGRHAALSAVGDDGRERELMVANPGEVEAALRVTVVGRNAVNPVVVAEELRIAPGAWQAVSLEGVAPLEGAFAVLVDVVEGTAVVGMVSASENGPLDLTAVLAKPFGTRALVADVAAVQDRTLLHPIVTPSPEPAPSEPAG